MITWDEIPKVAVDFMNQDHQECVALLARMPSLFADADQTEIDKALQTLSTHLREHFAREEQAMEETGFPPYYVHKTEHDSVLQQFQQAVTSWHADRNLADIERFVTVSFVNWLETHAVTMDMVTAEHLARHNMNKTAK